MHDYSTICYLIALGIVAIAAILTLPIGGKMKTFHFVIIRNGSVFMSHKEFDCYFSAYSWALQHVAEHGGVLQSIKEN